MPRNAQPVPKAEITRPAIAGPRILARLKVVEFSATAFGRSAGPTISTTKACRIGESSAENTPTIAASSRTCQSAITPLTSSTPSTSAARPNPDWVPSISLRLSPRSASAPP